MSQHPILEAEWNEVRRAGLLAGALGEARSIPDVLLPYQMRLLQATARNKVTLCEKSRRIGMTWAIGADAVLTAAATRQAGGMDTLYIGYNLDLAREFVDVCAMWARAFNHAMTDGVRAFPFDDGATAIQAFRIRFASGFEIVALSSKPRSLRGRQGYVIVDEAAFHDDLDALMQAALALLIWGGKVLVISTHYGEANAFNRLIVDARAGRTPYVVVRVTFDDALADGLYARICMTTRREWSAEAQAAWRAETIAYYGAGADEELFCTPGKGGGTYLMRALIEARMEADLPVFRLERDAAFAGLAKEARELQIAQWCETLEEALNGLDARRLHAFGVDFGRVADLTVIVPIAHTRSLARRVPFVIELRNIPFEQQRQILFHVADRLPCRLGGKMDATGNGAYLAEVAAQRYGMGEVEQVRLSQTWYLENFPPLKAAFEDATITLPRDADLADDLAAVKILNGVPQIPPARNTARGRHADFAVALVLAYAASRSDAAEYGYIAAGGDEAERSIFAERPVTEPMLAGRGARLW